jgi:hypothetical protein
MHQDPTVMNGWKQNIIVNMSAENFSDMTCQVAFIIATECFWCASELKTNN